MIVAGEQDASTHFCEFALLSLISLSSTAAICPDHEDW